MSMSQFKKWLSKQGVTKGPHCYMIPSKGAVLSAEDAQRRLNVTIATGSRDRHGDILEPGGAQIAGYLKNPVVLWAHQYRDLPIGRAASIVREGNSLKAEILFAPTEFAGEVYTLYAKGFLRAWSVGFLPLEWEVLEDKDGKFAGYHVHSWELVELSAVPVPANPEALTVALKKDMVREPQLKKSLLDALNVQSSPRGERESKAAKAAGAAGAAESEADVSSRTPGSDEPDTRCAPEIALPDLAQALVPKLLVRLRPCLGETVSREIRRRQGRLD